MERMKPQEYSLIQLENLVLAVFQEGKKPDEIKGIKSVKNLGEIHDLVSLFFVDRDVKTISALRIEEFYPISDKFGGILRGIWELGGYNADKKCFYSMGVYPIQRAPFHQRQTFVTQQRLSAEEVYIEDALTERFG